MRGVYVHMTEISYEQYRERLVTCIAKNAQRKIMKARREERNNRVRQLGGGKHIAALMLKPCERRKRR